MLFIHGIGHFHPENELDNRFLESLDIGTTNDWILERTGIRTRRTVLPLSYIRDTRNSDPRVADEAAMYTNADTGALAAKKAIAEAGLQVSDIKMVVAGSSAPWQSTPAEASRIADRLGISAPVFDINSACPTFSVQLRILSLLEEQAVPDFTLVVVPDNLTRRVNYRDRNVAVLMGDCSVAAVVSKRVPARAKVVHSLQDSDPRSWTKVVIPASGYLTQDGAAVQAFAIRTSVATVERLRDRACRDFYFVGHQANLTMLQSTCSRCDIPQERHLFNVDRYGNCGAAGSASVLSENWSRFQDGSGVVMAVVGAGLTWAGVVIRFGGTDELRQ